MVHSSDDAAKDVTVDVPDIDPDLKTGMRITFRNLVYDVLNKQDKKQKLTILHGLSGFFNPSQMTAVMGPSGSGKSTLLDILAQRKTVGKLKGQVLIAGYPPTQTFLRRYAGYVEQFDTLIPVLTVHEMLLYTAELKISRSVPLQEKKARVEQLIQQLALQACRNTTIGSSLDRGVSGGELKRTNVGIALVASPRVLFLDEPTSGLDSFTASEVMEVVKGLVTSGITIAATIHSPTPRTFQLFDRVLILQRGRIVFFGDNGESAKQYFAVSPHFEVRHQRQTEATADWVVDITTWADRQGRAMQFADAYNQSQLKQQNEQQLQKFLANEEHQVSARTLKQLRTRKATVTPSWWALLIMFKYRSRQNFKQADYLGPRLCEKALAAFLIFTVYWKIGDKTDAYDVPNIGGLLFLWVTLPAYGACAYTPAIVLERPVFVREQSDGLYRVITYLTFKVMEEVVLAVASSVVFSLLVYYLVRLQGSFFPVWIVFLVTQLVGVVLAYLIAAISPNMDTANAALPAYVTVLLFFSGFLITWPKIPKYWIWMAYMDFMRYGWGALMINQFQGQNVQLFGQDVLEYYGLDGYSTWEFIAYEIVFFFGFFCLCWFALVFKKHQKR
ncbi:hypothetical protein WJX77_006274 [Trebouxia sp. C0004]